MKGSSDFQISNGILYNYIGPGGDVVVPDGVTAITGYAFKRRNLQSVCLPEGLIKIGAGAFQDCSALTAIHIPKSVTHIETGAFGSCPNLTEISVEKGNPCFTVQDGFLLDRRTLSCCPGGKSGSVAIPNGVRRVPGLAFDGCSKITELIFPGSVTTINCGAFQNTHALRRVVLPANLKQLYAGIFQNCAALEEVVLPDTLEKIGYYAFASSGLRHVTLPAALKNVCKGAFENCVHLEEVVILSADVRLTQDAFSYCSGLRRLTITGTPHIKPSMFPQALETVIADGIPLADLPKGSFRNAAIVTFAHRILAGETPPRQDEYLKYIENHRRSLYTPAVKHEELLQLMLQHKFFTSRDIQPLLNAAKDDIPARAAILEYQDQNGGPPDPFEEMEKKMAKAERIAVYIEKNGKLPVSELKKIWSWKKREDGTLCITSYKGTDTVVTVPDKIGQTPVTAIEKTFDSNSRWHIANITAVTLPESLTEIGKHTFFGCASLQEISIPAGVIKIGADAFNSCTSLTAVTLPDSITEIGRAAFERCTALTLITLPAQLGKIEYNLFEYSGLKCVRIEEGIQEIGFYALSYCKDLTDIILPASVTRIDRSAFCCCGKGLTLYAPAGSYAEAYAKKNHINYKPLNQ